MSDDLDLDMEVVEDDELDELGAGGVSSSEHSQHGRDESEEEKNENAETEAAEDAELESINSSESLNTANSSDGNEEERRQRGYKSDTKKRSGNFETIQLGPKALYVPSQWSLTTFEEANDSRNPIGYGVVKPGPNIDDGIPLIRITDVIDGQLETGQDFHRISDELDEQYSRSRLGGGELLVSIQGTIGEVVVVPPELGGANISRTLARITPGEGINTYWAKYFLESKAAQDYMEVVSSGSTRASYNIGDIRKTKLPVPPLPEQRKIASVLYAVDQAIQKTEAIIEQAQRMKRGLMLDLLQEGPNPGKSEPEETRFGPVLTRTPNHWDRAKIGELYSEYQLGTTERGGTEGGRQIPLIKMGNLDFGTWDFSEVEMIEYDRELLETYHLKKGDLLFNTRNTPDLVGKTAVWESDTDAIYDNNLLRLRFNDRIASGHYVNYYLSSSIGRRQLRARVHGTTSVAAIYQSDLEQVEIPVPPVDEQRQIVQDLQATDQFIERNTEVRDELKRLKKGLMQDLLTGEVRTVDKAIKVLNEVKAHG